MPDVHALLSASSAHRWINCPPSVLLCKDLPDEAGPAAEEGTLAHAIVEERLTDMISGKKRRYKASSKLQKSELYRPVMEEHVETYLAYVENLLVSARERSPDAELFSERRVNFSRYVPDGFGTSDTIILSDGEMDICDFKYGKGVPVSAEDNPQLRLYALGALEEFADLYGIDKVRMHIVQPRLGSDSCEELTTDELYGWGLAVAQPAAELAITGAGAQKCGDWCRFCKVKDSCKARAEEMLKLAQYDFADAKLLTDDEIGEILLKVDELAAWAKDVKSYALSRALDGQSLAGWKLVRGRANRRITNPRGALQALVRSGFQAEDLVELKGLTALEDIVGNKNLTDICGAYIEKPEGKPTLVRETDKREALDPATLQQTTHDFD